MYQHLSLRWSEVSNNVSPTSLFLRLSDRPLSLLFTEVGLWWLRPAVCAWVCIFCYGHSDRLLRRVTKSACKRQALHIRLVSGTLTLATCARAWGIHLWSRALSMAEEDGGVWDGLITRQRQWLYREMAFSATFRRDIILREESMLLCLQWRPTLPSMVYLPLYQRFADSSGSWRLR